MIKILLILLFLITIPIISLSATLDLGLSAHYEPTAGKFEKGFNEWTYTTETVSIGIMGSIEFGDATVLVSDRIIFGSNHNGSNIIPIGQRLSTSVTCLDAFLVVNYSFETYWGSDQVDLTNEMSISPVHRLSVDMSIPFFSINLY